VTTYLVLGASGFLGSHVHEAITQSVEAPSMVAVSRRPPRISLPARSSWVPLDLNRATVEELVILIEASRSDAVINCAGLTSGTAEQMWETNTTFVDKLVQALRQCGPVPLVHFGSAAEYGVQSSNEPILETASEHPVSDYGRSKLAATRKITFANEQGDICAVVLRVFSPVGSRQPIESLAGKAVHELNEAIKANSSFIMMGPLSAYRDFVAARDVASAALGATQLLGRASIINVGLGKAMSCRAMVELVADTAGFDGEIREEGPGSDDYEEVAWQVADVSRMGHEIGWMPRTSVSQAVEELWRSESESKATNGGIADQLRSW
jgi:nucleoside-diphosphate-sugar epimerase